MKLVDRYRRLEDPLRTERWAELVLVAVVLLLALQLLWGAFRAAFPSVPEPVTPRPNALKVAQLKTAGPVDPDLRAEISARPLFWASRRPPEPEPKVDVVAELQADQEEKQQPGKIDGVKLTGVFGSGEAAGIIVLAKGKKRRVMVGEEIDGWNLKSVDPSEAVFTSSGREATLALKHRAVEVSQADATNAAEGSAEAGKQGKATKAKRKTEPKPANDTLTLGGRPSAKS